MTTNPEILVQIRRILDGTASPETPVAAACCSASKREVCCEPSEKAACCGTSSGSGCGCQ